MTKSPFLFVSLVILFSLPAASRGTLQIDFSQNGSTVLVTGSGFLDTTGLELRVGPAPVGASRIGDYLNDTIQSWDAGATRYIMPLESKASFFSGTSFFNIDGVSSGDDFGIYQNAKVADTMLHVPPDFTEGNIYGELTLPNTDLESLGIIEDSFEWGAGEGQGVYLTTNAVPEPASFGFLSGGMCLLSALMRRRR